jgi:VanZ family protein
MGVIFYFSAQSSLPSPQADWLEELRNIAGHFFSYAILALLLWWAVAAEGRLTRRQLAFVITWCAVYALSDEWHQSLVPNRVADVKDWITDLAGALAGCAIYFRALSGRSARISGS